ncbi:hypothetical protein [Kribbella sp. NBC_00359]|uniref:hypothetical protein n=1 Tax=Kribbella sp. NBC_00359 TaxID=2975966 RepID=UPI002E22A9AC
MEIGVASRCVGGQVVTPVGLCLARTSTGKQAWPEQLGVEVVRPMSGMPYKLNVDKAREFKSEALRRGCKDRGIALSYRQPRLRHFGGIVEWVIGMMMRLVHDPAVRGATFSNVAQRGAYDSDRRAVLTMTDLNAWLALAVACYRGQVHDGLGRTPAAIWTELARAQRAP